MPLSASSGLLDKCILPDYCMSCEKAIHLLIISFLILLFNRVVYVLRLRYKRSRPILVRLLMKLFCCNNLKLSHFNKFCPYLKNIIVDERFSSS